MNIYRLSVPTEDMQDIMKDIDNIPNANLVHIGNTSRIAALDVCLSETDISYLRLKYNFILCYKQNE